MTDSAPTVTRKSLLYKSRLGFVCINHAVGCAHGCRYPCHGFMLAKRYGRVRDYAEWCRPRLVKDAVGLLERELRSKRKKPSEVSFSLSTDPFMVNHPEITRVTLALAQRLNEAGIACSFLTKGLLPGELADGSRFSRQNTHSISLVSLDEGFRRTWEPGASAYAERLAALRWLHDAGKRTVVHMEPYPTPNLIKQELRVILEEIGFVDEIRFGGWNYNPKITAYPNHQAFYASCRALVRRFCEEHRIHAEVW